MTRFLFSAQDICTTRLCAARDCGFDAELGDALCVACQRRQARGIPIPLHATPERLPDTLRCSTCNTWKPDEDFPMIAKEKMNTGGRNPGRRGRYCNCRACEKRLRKARRLKLARARGLVEGSGSP